MESRFIDSPTISINGKTCSKCELCVKTCPTRIYKLSKDEKNTLIIANREEECVLCGQCLSVCSTNSITHSGFVTSNFKQILNRKPVEPEVAFEFLSQRRSVRNYKKEIPSSELLEKIINIAGYAPGSPHHRVGWVRNITVVSGSANMKVIADMTSEYVQKIHNVLTSSFIKLVAKFSESARAGIGVVPDLQMRLNEYRNGKDLIIYNAPVAIFAHAPMKSSTPQTDCDTALLMIQLFAEANGIGTCWNGLIQGAASGDHIKGFTKLAEFLKIPEGHRCYAAMTAGFTSINLHSIPERKVDITWIT